MADIEKVIKGLDYCTHLYLGCKECPYFGTSTSKSSCECQLKTDALELLKKQVPMKPEHIHEEYPEHEWVTNEKGEIDEFAMDYDIHNGPSCKRCFYSFCMHCKPDGWNDEPCIVDYYKCPKCHKQICKNKAFCEYCGQAVKWE